MTLSVDISHSFKDFGVEVQFDAPDGVTALFGPSGAGKSTIVNVVAGLLAPERGRVAIDNRVLLDTAKGIDLPVHRRRIGYVFQEGRLFPHLSVRGNLRFGQKFARKDARQANEDQIVELLDIRPLLDRRPAGLSGGEKQRVAIGRALLSAPEFLLMDEPLAALDEARRGEILPYLERLNSETNLPILYVSHSRSEVRRLATTVVSVERGRLLRSGGPGEILDDPLQSLIRVRVGGAEVAFAPEMALIVPFGTATSAGLTLDAMVASVGNSSDGGTVVTLSVAGAEMTLSITAKRLQKLDIAPGNRCGLAIPDAAISRIQN